MKLIIELEGVPCVECNKMKSLKGVVDILRKHKIMFANTPFKNNPNSVQIDTIKLVKDLREWSSGK